jgi:hypothetical protein
MTLTAKEIDRVLDSAGRDIRRRTVKIVLERAVNTWVKKHAKAHGVDRETVVRWILNDFVEKQP